MKLIFYVLLWSGAVLAGPSLQRAGFTESEIRLIEELSPARLPSPPQDRSNRFADDPKAAALGRKFFFDSGFSGALLDGDNNGSPATLGRKGETGKVACAGCHLSNGGFSDTRSPSKQISLASGWGVRKAISLLDVGQEKLLMWDGRRDALYNQVFAAIESRLEMNSSRLYVAEQIFKRYRAEYEAIFGPLPPLDEAKRFPPLTAEQSGCHPDHMDAKAICPGAMHGIPGDHAEYDHLSAADKEAVDRVVANFGKAIAAYERKLICGPTHFDRWARGNENLKPAEMRGLKLFIGKARCVTCHSGPYFSDFQFHNLGLRPRPVASAFGDMNDPGAYAGLTEANRDPLNVRGKMSDGDDGRLPERVGASLRGAFKTPKLRCVSSRPSFMHTAQYTDLKSLIDFFNRGGDSAGPVKGELKPLYLSESEKSDLLAFLKSLDGPGATQELTR